MAIAREPESTPAPAPRQRPDKPRRAPAVPPSTPAVSSIVPVSCRIEGSLILLESSEEATFGEWVDALATVGRHTRWRPGLSVVHDLRRSRSLPGPMETVLRLDFLKERNQALRIERYAVVIAESSHPGVGRVAEGLAEGKAASFRVFRDWGAAVAWASPESSAT
jgi:hypothetical protein